MAIIARFNSSFARATAVAKRVVAFVKTQARKGVAAVSAVAKRVKPVAKRAWTVALRPFLGGVIAGTSLGIVVIGAIVAPFTTVLTLLVTGLLAVGSARLVGKLEDTAVISRFSRVSLNVLEFIGQALRALMYAGAVLFTLAMAATSIPFAVFAVLALTLAYFDVRGGGTIAFLAWCMLSGSWVFGLLWMTWHGAARMTFSRPVEISEYSEIRQRPPVEHAHALHADHVALYAEADAALAEMPTSVEHACDACGIEGMRIRSNAVPFVTCGGKNFGKAHESSNAMLCSDCYAAECEDNAIALTGVSLSERSVIVALNALGRVNLPEYMLSKDDTTQAFWAVTAWWRDRRGHHHDRQWDCLYDGAVVASVTYDHNRKVYRASARGKFLSTKTSLGSAQRLAVDTFNDELTKGYGVPDPRSNSPQRAVELGLIAGGVR
jgi:hypothetical protein